MSQRRAFFKDFRVGGPLAKRDLPPAERRRNADRGRKATYVWGVRGHVPRKIFEISSPETPFPAF